MVKFNFEDVVIIWINCSSNSKRHQHMKNLLQQHFPKNKQIHVEAVMHSPKYQGVTMAHTVALLKGISTGKSFLILEDDVNIDATNMQIKKLENEIEKMEELPRVLYMGLSDFGSRWKNHFEIFNKINNLTIQYRHKILFKKGAYATATKNDFFIRIKDMYAAHAILYFSNDYALKTLNQCIKAVELNKPHDILLPNLMQENFVYGLRHPWFYQWNKMGGQEYATNINLDNSKKIE